MSFEESEVAMGGLVLDCCMCHRLMIYPIHIKKFLGNWNKNGRTCIRCLVKYKYSNLGLEGYIEEFEAYLQVKEGHNDMDSTNNIYNSISSLDSNTIKDNQT